MEKITKSSDKVLIDPNEPLILPDGTALVGRVEWFLYALCCLDYQNLPTPMSRIEEFANALITGEIPNIQPQSRAEQFFLAILDGNISDLPQPQSRSEVLLDKLARGEFDLSDVEPIQSRYELLLAYLIKNGGIGNIDYVLYEFSEAMKTMYNTVEKPFKSLELSGNTLVNCVLEDTENDDYTSFDEDYSGTSFTINGTSEGAIKSAILKGQTLVNVHGKKAYGLTQSEETMGANKFTNIVKGENQLSFDMIDELTYGWGSFVNGGSLNLDMLKPNTKYLVYFTTAIFPEYFGVSFRNGDGANLISTQVQINKGGNCAIITTTNEIVKSNQILYISIPQEHAGHYEFKDAMIIEYQKGMENWDIPYFEGMQSVKMPVLHTVGKNLFNINGNVNEKYDGLGASADPNIVDGNVIIPSSKSDWHHGKGQKIKIKRGEAYTCSFTTSDGGIVDVYSSNLKYWASNKSSTFTFTAPTDCDEVLITFATRGAASGGKIYNFQIEEGSAATPYEPYKSNILSTPQDLELRGIGDVKDELNVATGELTQRIGEYIIDGSEDWNTYNGYNVEGYKSFITTITGLNNLYTGTKTFISGDIKMGSWGSYMAQTAEEMVWNHDPNKIGIKVKNETASNVEELKTFLASNPIRIKYELATESIKTVDLNVVDQNNTKIDKIHVFDETTHVNASSDELTPTVNIGKSVSYPTIIKPNTKYTIDLKRNDKPLTVNLGGTEVTFVDGETRKTITTPSTLINDKLSYYGIGAKCNEIMLIEGEVERNIDYFTGMQSVKAPTVSTVGSNLINLDFSSSWNSEKYDYEKLANGYILDNTIGRISYNRKLKNLIVGELYTFSCNIEFLQESDRNKIQVYFNSQNKAMYGGTRVTDGELAWTFTYDQEYEEFGIYFHTDGNIEPLRANITNVRINSGGEVLEYEPYKSSILSLSEEVKLCGIDNTKDMIDCNTKTLIKNINEVIFDGSDDESWRIYPDLERDNTLLFQTGYDMPYGKNHHCISDKYNHNSSLWNTDCDEEGIMIGGGGSNYKRLDFRIAKNKLSSYNVSGLKLYLQSNPITIQYKLANPIVETVDLSVIDQDGNTIPKIKSYKDVTHLEVTVPKQSLLPNVSAEVATDNSKDMPSLTTKHQEISETQSAIQDNIQSQSDEIDTALMATTEIFESILE